MVDWSLPLIVAIGAFLTWLLWRVRPAPPGWGRPSRVRREALEEARARVLAAPDGATRALALCDAADLMARRLVGVPNATGLYLRAMRSDPQSSEVVQRAAVALASRPRALEALLWRHLAVIGPWNGPARAPARASLDLLRGLYDGPLRNAVRARALANALGSLNPLP
jgi:hypothetical protein